MKDKIVPALVGAAAVAALWWWLKRRPCCAECAGAAASSTAAGGTTRPDARPVAGGDAAVFDFDSPSTSGGTAGSAADLATASDCGNGCGGSTTLPPLAIPTLTPLSLAAEIRSAPTIATGFSADDSFSTVRTTTFRSNSW